MSVRSLNSQDVGKNIKVGFFSKENTATRCMARISSYKDSLKTQFLVLENSLNTSGILCTKSSVNSDTVVRVIIHGHFTRKPVIGVTNELKISHCWQDL